VLRCSPPENSLFSFVFPRVANSAQSEFDARLSTVSWVAVANGTEKAEDCRLPRSGRTMFSAAGPPRHAGAGNPIGISTAIIAGASAAQDVGKPRQNAQADLGAGLAFIQRAKETTHSSEQPSTPATQQFPVGFA
jgi:hypothetical protein